MIDRDKIERIMKKESGSYSSSFFKIKIEFNHEIWKEMGAVEERRENKKVTESVISMEGPVSMEASPWKDAHGEPRLHG
jgi:hypothetical protein